LIDPPCLPRLVGSPAKRKIGSALDVLAGCSPWEGAAPGSRGSPPCMGEGDVQYFEDFLAFESGDALRGALLQLRADVGGLLDDDAGDAALRDLFAERARSHPVRLRSAIGRWRAGAPAPRGQPITDWEGVLDAAIPAWNPPPSEK